MKFYSERNLEQTEVRECLLSFGVESLVIHFLLKNVKTEMHRDIILPVLLYGREIWSLILREERRLG